MSKAPPSEIICGLREAGGQLYHAVNSLTGKWVAPVRSRLADIGQGRDLSLRAKLLNDPVWSTLELESHEVLLLDSPLLQRLRGVRQLGLAHLVFPGANHDRFEHVCGVVGSSDRMFDALRINVLRRTGKVGGIALPKFEESDRKLVRLAALLHDVGHGPFSHAVEPVIERRYEKEFRAFSDTLKNSVDLDAKTAAAEAISALMIISEAFADVLRDKKFDVGVDDVNLYQLRLAALVLGARSHDQESCFSAIISSQIDADKLDYMARDAHHTGMPITFDTERLIRKLEVVQCTADNLPPGKGHEKNIAFARESPGSCYSDIAVLASGVGALEQMLIGRAFLYDRLYHHHKVRAADAMAQRLIHFAEMERGKAFELDELYLDIGDDSMIRVLGGQLSHPDIRSGGENANFLARSILERDLFHRAFAFRASFHSAAETNSTDLSEIWAPISTELSAVDDRIAFEEEIFGTAKAIANAVFDPFIKKCGDELIRPHIIVDLSDNRIKPVTINVHAGDGFLEAPNLFFDPSRWSNVYDLQKRTGYVFAPRKMVPLVGLAAEICFFERWGYVGSPKSRRIVKDVVRQSRHEWLNDLRTAGLIDELMFSVLDDRATVRMFLRAEEVSLPQDWTHESSDLSKDIADQLRVLLPQGMSSEDLTAVKLGLKELASFVDMAYKDPTLTKSEAMDEADLQRLLVRHLRSRGNEVIEGEKVAGGETDVLVAGRCLVENKIDKSGKGPFDVKAEAPYQANRYAMAKCLRVFFTLVAYKPENESVIVRMTDSILVSKLDELNKTAVEIRFSVPFGLVSPSRVKVPSKTADA